MTWDFAKNWVMQPDILETAEGVKIYSCQEKRRKRMKTYFISGHGDLSKAEFEKHYEDQIVTALGEGGSFVIGDYKGCDKLANDFFSQFDLPIDKVTIYHMGQAPRFETKFRTSGGFKSDEERDEAMTRASHEDIAWVRPGKTSSGTQRNLDRREEIKNEVVEEVEDIVSLFRIN